MNSSNLGHQGDLMQLVLAEKQFIEKRERFRLEALRVNNISEHSQESDDAMVRISSPVDKVCGRSNEGFWGEEADGISMRSVSIEFFLLGIIFKFVFSVFWLDICIKLEHRALHRLFNNPSRLLASFECIYTFFFSRQQIAERRKKLSDTFLHHIKGEFSHSSNKETTDGNIESFSSLSPLDLENLPRDNSHNYFLRK